MDSSWTDPLVSREVRVVRAVEPSELAEPPWPVSLGGIIANLGQLRVTVDGYDDKVFVIPSAGEDFPGVAVKAVRSAGMAGALTTRMGVPLLKEFERLLSAAKAQLPVPRPYVLLAGKDNMGAHLHYLVMEGIDNAITLEGWLTREGHGIERNPRLKALIATTLGTLVARLHKARFFHGELDAGSMLLHDETPDEAAELRLWLVDIDAAEFIERPTEEQVVANLARLGCWFVPRTTRADRMRFFMAYCREAGYSGSVARKLMRHAERESLRTQYHLGSAAIAHSLDQSPEIQQLSGPDWRAAWRQRAGAMKWHMLEATLPRSDEEPGNVMRKFVQERVSPDRLQTIESPLGPGGMRKREHAVSALWGLMCEMWHCRIPMGEPLGVFFNEQAAVFFLRHGGVRLPLDAMLRSRQTRPRMRAMLFSRIGRLIAAMHSHGAYIGNVTPDDVLARVAILMAYENPDPRPILTTADHVMRNVPLDEASEAESLALWLVSAATAWGKLPAGHMLRSYLRATMFGQPRKAHKDRARNAVARALRLARRTGKLPRGLFKRR